MEFHKFKVRVEKEFYMLIDKEFCVVAEADFVPGSKVINPSTLNMEIVVAEAKHNLQNIFKMGPSTLSDLGVVITKEETWENRKKKRCKK